MDSKYRVTFDDGTYVDQPAPNADVAKERAKNARYNEVDPGRRMLPADRERNAKIKVSSVAEIVAKGNNTPTAIAPTRGARGASGSAPTRSEGDVEGAPLSENAGGGDKTT